jgi:hypothetical protein
VSETPRCWYCSEEIASTERTRVVADLNVLVHVGCFDRLYASEGLASWSTLRRPADDPKPRRDDDDEEEKETKTP